MNAVEGAMARARVKEANDHERAAGFDLKVDLVPHDGHDERRRRLGTFSARGDCSTYSFGTRCASS